MRHERVYGVEGEGPFPADMLRAERGEGSSQGRGLRTEPGRGCEGPRSVRQALQAVVSEGGERTRGRLGD